MTQNRQASPVMNNDSAFHFHSPPASRRRYAVWAPEAEEIELVIVTEPAGELAQRTDGLATADTWPVTARYRLTTDDQAGGWWWLNEKHRGEIPNGAGYGYVLDGSGPFPDPRSRYQPDGVHGPSRPVPPLPCASSQTAPSHPARSNELAEMVIYELHPGTFSPTGDFAGIIERLDYLVELGVTHVELMPVAGFPGRFGWSYDGVNWFAIQASYGGPAEYARLVQAAHARGLGIIQDVVYNHWGPEGHYLNQFGPYQRADETRWGAGPNLDGPDSDEVRTYILDQARMLLLDYEVDGFRLDAVHALSDTQAVHILQQLRALTDEIGAQTGVNRVLIAESDLNDPRMIDGLETNGLGPHGQWSDDFHHAVHVAATGETQGYYADFADPNALPKAIDQGFFHDGTYSSFRGRHHGRALNHHRHRPSQLIVSIQNHDQVGNRAAGDRPTASIELSRAMGQAALMLLAPGTPMLFMGEEFATRTPFPFFVDFAEPEVITGVSTGRRLEFAATGWDPDTVPEPTATATRDLAVLDWDEPNRVGHRQALAFYRRLIQLRRQLPALLRTGESESPEALDSFDSVHTTVDPETGLIHLIRTVPTAPGPAVPRLHLLLAWGPDPVEARILRREQRPQDVHLLTGFDPVHEVVTNDLEALVVPRRALIRPGAVVVLGVGTRSL